MKKILEQIEDLKKQIKEQPVTSFRDSALGGLSHAAENLQWHNEEMEKRVKAAAEKEAAEKAGKKNPTAPAAP